MISNMEKNIFEVKIHSCIFIGRDTIKLHVELQLAYFYASFLFYLGQM